MPAPNLIPERVTRPDLDAALRVLGIASSGTGLISLNVDFLGRRITVVRNIKDHDGRPVVGGFRASSDIAIGGER